MLLCVILTVAILLPVYVVFYADMFPQKWSAHKDTVIKAYANSFMYHTSWEYGSRLWSKEQADC